MTAETVKLGPDQDGNVLLTRGDRVACFGETPSLCERDAFYLDCADGWIQPGRINAHTHVYSGLAPLGMPPPERTPENFLQILERVWWRLDRALDRDSLRASALYYVSEALLSGTTTLIDHHESPNFVEGSLDVLADSCQELGMRAVLCYGVTERNAGREEAKWGLEECARFIRENTHPLVRGVVGLHASFTVSDETIVEAGNLCRELDTVMHVHLAEDMADVWDARKREYHGPLERLLKLKALPAGSILAHGVHLSRDQVRRCADLGLWLVQNPRSNLGNAVGYPTSLDESRRVALGTDGYPADMSAETEALYAEARSHGEPEAVVSRRVTAGAGLARQRFELDFDPLTEDAAADAAVFTENAVRHVVVGGRLVVKDGVLLTADQKAVYAEANQQAKLLWARMAS